MLYFPCPGSPYFADPLGSSSYIVLATDYISSGLLCTCQELNVLSLFYVHRWISLFCPSIENSTSSPFSSPTSEFQLLVLSTHVLSLFFVRSQGLLFTPAAEAQGGPRPNREGCSFAFSIVLEIPYIISVLAYIRHIPIMSLTFFSDGECASFDWAALCLWLCLPPQQDHPGWPL